MLGKVVAENARAIGRLQKLQPFFVKLLERNLLSFQMIENSECNFHQASSSGGDFKQSFRVRRQCLHDRIGRIAP